MSYFGAIGLFGMNRLKTVLIFQRSIEIFNFFKDKLFFMARLNYFALIKARASYSVI